MNLIILGLLPIKVHGIWSLYNEYCAQDQGVDPIVKEWVDTLKLDQENLV